MWGKKSPEIQGCIWGNGKKGTLKFDERGLKKSHFIFTIKIVMNVYKLNAVYF